jgi:hypothetical protein
MKVDLIIFPCCAWTFQSELACDRGDCHKLVFFCSPNPACSNLFPFRSSPWFLSKTRVHGSPRSKYDGHELKSVITWWLSWQARARLMGPEIGTCIGIDVLVVWMSSSRSQRSDGAPDSRCSTETKSDQPGIYWLLHCAVSGASADREG